VTGLLERFRSGFKSFTLLGWTGPANDISIS
jgi:hypothetical protein